VCPNQRVRRVSIPPGTLQQLQAEQLLEGGTAGNPVRPADMRQEIVGDLGDGHHADVAVEPLSVGAQVPIGVAEHGLNSTVPAWESESVE
jgi:hypothetical protein